MTQPFIPGVQSAIARNAASYDDLPYESHPFPQTHPGRLAATARIFGLDAPPVGSARVLELGCAAGGNLIPLAARFPGARFLGIDLSQRQIDEGLARVSALGLSNISLRRQSLTDLRPKDGTYDYIICHGVYSWAPAPVREAILRIARDNLAPTGVAYVSYNVLPGWRLRQTLRDALALHVARERPLQAQVAQAREMLSFLEDHTAAETTWGRIFRGEAAQLRNASDSYIGHEFLEDCNEPCSFAEFMRDADKLRLAYLGEAELFTMLPENMNPAAAPLLRALAGDHQIAMEQHIDIFTGRTFRQSLLVHKEREARLVRRLLPPVMEGLHFLARPSFAFAREEAGQAVFADATGARFSTGDPATRKAAEILVARLPGSSSLDELMAGLEKEGGRADEPARANVADALLKMTLANILDPSTEPARAAASPVAKPVACPLVRGDAAANAVRTANLRHESVALEIVAQIATPLLDGTNDRDTIVAAVLAAAAEGRVSFQRAGAPVTEASDLEACCEEHVDRLLADLARSACLIA